MKEVALKLKRSYFSPLLRRSLRLLFFFSSLVLPSDASLPQFHAHEVVIRKVFATFITSCVCITEEEEERRKKIHFHFMYIVVVLFSLSFRFSHSLLALYFLDFAATNRDNGIEQWAEERQTSTGN